MNNETLKNRVIGAAEFCIREIVFLDAIFEFNDEATRALIKTKIDERLERVQQCFDHEKEYFTEFLTVCDETNNTPEVIADNSFKFDSYLKFGETFTVLNFILTKTGVSFQEVVGRMGGAIDD